VTADCRCPELAPNVQLQRRRCVLILNSWFINETETSFTLMIMWWNGGPSIITCFEHLYESNKYGCDTHSDAACWRSI